MKISYAGFLLVVGTLDQLGRFTAIVAAATTTSISYNWVSKTRNGKACLNTCVEGKCYVDHHLNEEPCTVDPVAGVPLYHTSLGRGDISHCLSNCGNFGYNYEWCYTTEDYNWDYCSSTVKGPNNEYGHDIYGNKCVEECTIYTYTPSRCHIESQAYNECAPPARIPVQSCLNLFFDRLRSRRSPALDRIFSPNLCTPVCRLRYRDGRDGETQDRIDRVYTSGVYASVENVTSFANGGPYTFVATANATNSRGDIVYLPLIMMATIRRPPYTRRESEDVPQDAATNVDNMYPPGTAGIDTGHIVAFVNGGTRDLFNFVGQTEALNRGPYKVIENVINSWIIYGGYAEFTVVVDYVGTRPDEFAVKLKLFNDDDSLHSDCLDIILKNI